LIWWYETELHVNDSAFYNPLSGCIEGKVELYNCHSVTLCWDVSLVTKDLWCRI